jgi:predicted ATP-grasp superfamily ATP-dependent carboligase
MPDRSAPLPDLLIVGASARAAAFSAVRAGLNVAAADLFADRDLAAVADATVIERWPEDIERWAKRFSSSIPLIFTGGLENHPELLGRLTSGRKIAGIIGEPLDIVRTPERLAALLTKHAVPVANLAGVAPQKGRWLVKPRRSGGGRGIRIFNGEPIAPGEYVQEFIEGTPGSAAFLSVGRDDVELLGVCQSLPATTELVREAMPFAYFGSVTQDRHDVAAFERLGRVLASIGVSGLFGVDFVRDANDECVIVEVNPRYTASMELYELQSGRSLVAEQLAACGARSAGKAVMRPAASDREKRVFGKRIIYAPYDLIADLGDVAAVETILRGEYEAADLPAPNASIPARAPICTVFAHTATAEQCCAELERREAAVLRNCLRVV